MAKVKTLTAHTVLAGPSVRSPKHKLEPSPDHDFLERRVPRSWQTGSGQGERMWRALPSVAYKRSLEFQK